ncbi:hypothetical protein ACLOJK_027289 [Asimina triloba]
MVHRVQCTAGAPKSGAPSSSQGASIAARHHGGWVSSSPSSNHGQHTLSKSGAIRSSSDFIFRQKTHGPFEILQQPSSNADRRQPVAHPINGIRPSSRPSTEPIQDPGTSIGSRLANPRAAPKISIQTSWPRTEQQLHPDPIRSSRCSRRQHQWPSAITPKPPPAATDPAFHGARSTSNDPASTQHAQILATNSRLQAMAPEQTMQQSSARTHRTSSMTVKASAIGHGQRLTAVVQHHASSEPTRSHKQRSTVRSTMGHQGSSGDESDGQRPATIRAGRASSRNPLSLPRTNGTWKQAAIAVTN